MRATHPTELDTLEKTEPFITVPIDGLTDIDVFYLTELKFLKDFKNQLELEKTEGFDALFQKYSECSYGVLFHIVRQFVLDYLSDEYIACYAEDKDMPALKKLMHQINKGE